METFFDEADIPEDISPGQYLLPGNRLDMENILLDFEQYVTRIGVGAFYSDYLFVKILKSLMEKALH